MAVKFAASLSPHTIVITKVVMFKPLASVTEDTTTGNKMIGTIDIKVRPLKLALLVDPGSTQQIREAIRIASSLWGGMYFPIIPLYKRMPASWRDGVLKAPHVKDVTRGYIEAFDPDILVQFTANLPTYVTDSQLKVINPQDIWANVGAGEDAEPGFGIGVLDLLGDIYREWFKFKAKYPVKVTIPTIPKNFGLFWAAVFGEYPQHVSAAIETYFSEPLEITRPDVAPGAFLDLTDQMVLFPRRITSWSVERHGSLRFGRDSCVYFMDAASIEDVIDYWNLRATGRSVVPLPKQFLQEESFRKAVEDFLVQERRPWRHDPKNFDVASIIRSRNSTMEEMSDYTKTLKVADSPTIGPEAHYFTLQHWYPRIWDQWARGKDGGVIDIYGAEEDSIEIRNASELEMRIKPLIPKFGRDKWFQSEGLCVNELDLRIYGSEELLAEVYPKAQGEHLIRAISSITLRGEWRIGRHGLVKIVQNLRSEPRKVPASDKIFFAWLKDHGWTAELSPPGILAKQIYKRLGGLVMLLANKSVLSLIEYMNGGSINKDGTPIRGGRVGPEREMSVREIKSRLGGKNRLSIHYDTFVEKGVFKLGYRTKCPNCQRNTWFALSSLRESLECPKCLNAFAAVGNIEQVKDGWYYRTAGPFSVPNFADGAFAVLITLHVLSDQMLSFLRTTSVPSFVASSPGKADLETDFAIFWKEMVYGEENEGLMFGECKTYGLFETKDIERMRYLGNTFPGTVLVFSTLRDALTKKEVSALTRLAKAGRKYWKAERPINPILILTGSELLSFKRPPFCWEESQHQRFQHIYNLMSLCDATQQLYLGLPPLQEDWRKRWEQRSKSRKDRQ
jgi:hypothetical protein